MKIMQRNYSVDRIIVSAKTLSGHQGSKIEWHSGAKVPETKTK